MTESLVVATTSCIAVGICSEADGQTQFILGSADEVDPGSQPAFEGRISVPSYKVRVATVDGVSLLETTVRDIETRIRVWVNHFREPDRIIIGIL